jgi:hypothetical protein
MVTFTPGEGVKLCYKSAGDSSRNIPALFLTEAAVHSGRSVEGVNYDASSI